MKKTILLLGVAGLAVAGVVFASSHFGKAKSEAMMDDCSACCAMDAAGMEVEEAAVETAEAGAAPEPKAYPLAVCVVSDEELGSMGAPFAFVHDGTEVKLCCKSCLRTFHSDPAPHLEKIRAAAEGQS